MHWFKAKALLLAIAVVWGFLIYSVWELQLVITLLGFLPVPLLKTFSKSFWLWQDQGVNVLVSFIIFLTPANPDITVSSKVGYLADQGSKTALAMADVIDFLFLVAVGQKDHCAASIERDEKHEKFKL